MAQNISLWGANYSNVPAVDLPKTGGGEARYADPSITTAVEADVASGKIFLKADGSQGVGTGSGGSGDGYVWQDAQGYVHLSDQSSGRLEYEEGTWIPTEDIARPTITFSDTHTTLPTFVMMTDATGTDDQTANTNYGVAYSSFYAYSGQGVPSNVSGNRRYALSNYVYRTSGNPSQGVTGVTALTGSGSYSVEYWVSLTGFSPSSANTGQYWRTGRTYKWIAIWTPTA